MSFRCITRICAGSYRPMVTKRGVPTVAAMHSFVIPVRASSAAAATSATSACHKFVGVLEDYREKNFGQTLFSRFVKETIGAMDADHDGKITLSELQGLLLNIGAQSSLSEADLMEVIKERGVFDAEADENVIYTYYIEDLILNGCPQEAA